MTGDGNGEGEGAAPAAGEAGPRDGTGPLARAVADALALIAAHGPVPPAEGRAGALPSLLEQARATEAAARARPPEPIRIVHQFACTGGTLINRCLSVLPNVRLLSEIEPLSRIMIDPERPLFTPSDLVHQLQHGPRPLGDDRLAEVFRAGLAALYRQCVRAGERLVLRDHAHSRFCMGEAVSTRPGLAEIAGAVAPLCAVVTVRHPVDSWLSLNSVGWVMFRPATIAEYARRYLAFLDACEGLPVFRYEDFVADPEARLQALAGALDLPYREGAPDVIDTVRMSGDSGRRAAAIAPRPRRPVPPGLAAEIEGDPGLAALCRRLGY